VFSGYAPFCKAGKGCPGTLCHVAKAATRVRVGVQGLCLRSRTKSAPCAKLLIGIKTGAFFHVLRRKRYALPRYGTPFHVKKHISCAHARRERHSTVRLKPVPVKHGDACDIWVWKEKGHALAAWPFPRCAVIGSSACTARIRVLLETG
jgi:hypothetical protein